MNEDERNGVIVIICGILLAIAIIVGLMIGVPKYRVWSAGKAGAAKLNEANYSRQIAVKEALAKKESAALLADAEVARARGVAKANKIIGDSLHGNEDYLRYLWIQNLENEKNQVIYVPTETNMPILEANRLKK